jgi:hypothetical protein
MAYGKLALGFQPRNDLVAHHVLALVCYGLSMALGVGHALVLVTLASEAMPCCSGLEAWGKHFSSEKMMRAGSKGRLLILLFWRLPLWAPYRHLLDSKVADINNVSEGGVAGAITAALFLQEFVDSGTPWVHLDIMAWNSVARPGRSVGGEAMGMRALFRLIENRFAGRRRRR